MHWFSRYDVVRRWISRLTQQVAQHERSRLARDLHDGLGQDLYAANLALSSLRERVPAEVTRQLDELIDRHVVMLDDMRRLVDERAEPGRSAPGTMTVHTLIADLTDVARRKLHTDPMTEIEPTAPQCAPSRLGHEAGFALREMISNAVRHSGASMIVVMLDAESDRLSLCVADDGSGIPPGATRGRGLDNLHHRASRCGGRFTLSSSPDVGSTARWVVPWSCRRGVSLPTAA